MLSRSPILTFRPQFAARSAAQLRRMLGWRRAARCAQRNSCCVLHVASGGAMHRIMLQRTETTRIFSESSAMRSSDSSSADCSCSAAQLRVI